MSVNELPEFISQALAKPVNYADDYVRSVLALKGRLEAALKASLVLDDDMNYNAAQSLTCKLAGNDEALAKVYEFDVRFYISSKSPLFAVYCFDRKWRVTDMGRANHPIAQERLPKSVLASTDIAKNLLSGCGFKEVEHRYFFLLATGCVTQMDGLPATVFECLFAEIV
ncbi:MULTISPECIES: hypothetical protein [Rhizobium]|uniref:hypothetical protein n=1 Tax=Rhizobium TaxID=379 RepID=UPI001FCC87C9|nr:MULTISPECIES: hypothetical protein [Rhizobium]